MVQDLSTWKVKTRSETVRNPAVDSTTLSLKWAHYAQTGEPRYIHDPEVAQGGCVCTCPACKLSLIPVMAGQPLRTRLTAHFRHPAGPQKDHCSVVAARLAAIVTPAGDRLYRSSTAENVGDCQGLQRPGL